LNQKKGCCTFKAIVQKLDSLTDFNPNREFCRLVGPRLPELPHHEIEIFCLSTGFLKNYIVDFHLSSENARPFVCYPLRIPTEAEAVRIFVAWSLSSVAAITEGVDLNTLMSECGGNLTLLETKAAEVFGILVKGNQTTTLWTIWPSKPKYLIIKSGTDCATLIVKL